MEIIQTGIRDLLVLKPRVFGDDRGYFFESFNRKLFLDKTGLDIDFVQDNQSESGINVLRGLHLQAPPHAQGKLVRVVRGSVLDVAVDIRKGSPTYGKHFKAELNEENHLMMWIPPGFAHGFSVLRDRSVFMYKCSGYYNKESERTIQWNDPALGIEWMVENPVVSEKDRHGIPFKIFESTFEYV
ncbi:MAG: dTDP-4-dehydrorhamnose 3,5-epimerase [Flavobacteriales bacterium]